MLVSTKYNFLFVHIPKSGGTSLRTALSSVSNTESRSLKAKVSRKLNPSERTWKNFNYDNFPHAGMAFAENLLPEKLFLGSVKIAVMRDPLEWVCSYYKHCLRYHLEGQFAHIYRTMPQTGELEAFLDWKTANGYVPTQTLALAMNNGYLPAINIFRYPSLNAVESFFSEKFNFEVKIGMKNVAPKSQGVEVSAEAIKKVEELFADDYALLSHFSSDSLNLSSEAFQVSQEGLSFLKGKPNGLYSFWDPSKNFPLNLGTRK